MKVTQFNSSLISLILNNQSRLLIARIELLVAPPTDSTKFNGVITPKMKLLGRKRNF